MSGRRFRVVVDDSFNAPPPRRMNSAKSKSSRKQKRQLAEKYVRELTERATPAEIALKEIFERHGIRYEFQKALIKRKDFYIVDFFLKDYATVVEVDGGYHFTPEQEAKDAKRTEAILRKDRFARVVRLTNDEILQGGDAVLQKLARAICPWAFNGDSGCIK